MSEPLDGFANDSEDSASTAYIGPELDPEGKYDSEEPLIDSRHRRPPSSPDTPKLRRAKSQANELLYQKPGEDEAVFDSFQLAEEDEISPSAAQRFAEERKVSLHVETASSRSPYNELMLMHSLNTMNISDYDQYHHMTETGLTRLPTHGPKPKTVAGKIRRTIQNIGTRRDPRYGDMVQEEELRISGGVGYSDQDTANALPFVDSSTRDDHAFLSQTPAMISINKPMTWGRRIRKTLSYSFKQAWFLLMLLATLLAVVVLGMSFFVDLFEKFGNLLMESNMPKFPRWLFWTGFRTLMLLSAVYLAYNFGPQAPGSGIPQLKAIMNGFNLPGYLSLNTLVVKVASLTLALASGLPIGIEGPMIHIASLIGDNLYTKLRVSRVTRRLIISAACAAGTGAALNAPIGGVLFSIEVTATYYFVHNYWSAFFCAIFGVVISRLIHQDSFPEMTLYNADLVNGTYKDRELFYYLALGVIGGVFGILIVKSHRFWVWFRRKYQKRILGTNPYGIAAVVIVSFCTVTFIVGDFVYRSYRFAIDDLFSPQSLDIQDNYVWVMGTADSAQERVLSASFDNRDWTSGTSHWTSLGWFVGIKWLFFILTSTLYIPCGFFTPSFVVGAGLGRIWGELLMVWYPDVVTNPMGYALVGAATVAGSVTQTISAAVIVMETTGQMSMLVPMLLAGAVGTGVANLFDVSVYESIMKMKNIPLISMRSKIKDAHKIEVADFMDTRLVYLPKDPELEEVEAILRMSRLRTFPIVQDSENMVLLAEATRDDLIHFSNSLQLYEQGKLKERPNFFAEPWLSQINQNPFQISHRTPLPRVYYLFHVLRPRTAYVLRRGQLVGIVTQQRLVELDRSSRTFMDALVTRARQRQLMDRNFLQGLRSRPRESIDMQPLRSRPALKGSEFVEGGVEERLDSDDDSDRSLPGAAGDPLGVVGDFSSTHNSPKDSDGSRSLTGGLVNRVKRAFSATGRVSSASVPSSPTMGMELGSEPLDPEWGSSPPPLLRDLSESRNYYSLQDDPGGSSDAGSEEQS